MDNRIADANKKTQPAPAELEGEATSEGCAKPVPAPLPSFAFDSHTHALKFIAASLTDLGGEQEALDTVCAHISDLTNRLADAEAERDSLRKRYDAMHEHMCALDSVFDDAIDTLRKETPNARTSQEEADARDMAEAFAALKGIAQAALAATDVKP